MALTLTGFVFDNAGNAIPGATVQGYVTADDQTSGTTAGDPVLTDANGKWAITTSDVDHIPMDVRITYGSSKRWIKAGDKLNLTDLTVSGKLTVGENDTGYDVQLHGATSGRSALWDESEDAFQLNDNTELKFGSLLAGDMVLYHDGSDSYIKNATGALKLATEATGIAVTIGHTTSEVTIGENLTVTGTLSLASIASNWTNASRTVADMGTVTTIDINGGTIDGAVIGATTPAAITGEAVTGTSLVGGTIAGTTGTFSGVVDITDATEASDATGDTGALRTEGGASIAKKLYVGTDLSVGNDLTVTGSLTVSGTTTTVDTANTVVTDNLLELNSGVASNANDSGIIIERGSTGDNAILMWDESATGFTVGTTTATAASTGDLANFAAAPFVAAAINGTVITASSNFAGALTGDVTGNADTVTTNADLTGHITSSGSNDTLLGSFTQAQLMTALGTNTVLVDADIGSTVQAYDADLLALAGIGTAVQGDIIYSDSNGSWARLVEGTNGHVLTLASGVPSWAAAAAGYSDADAIAAVENEATLVLQTGVVTGTMTLGSGSVVDSSGAISFDDENLSTTGTLAAGALTLSGALISSTDGTLDIGTDAAPFQKAYLQELQIEQLSGNAAIVMNAETAGTDPYIIFQEASANKWAFYHDSSADLFGIYNYTQSTYPLTFLDGTNDLSLTATGKLRLDYDFSGNSYIHEASADVVQVVAGGVAIGFNANGMEIPDSKFIEFAQAAGTPGTDNSVQGVVIEFLAAEAITQFDAVYVSTTTGRVGRALATDAAKMPVIGVAIETQGSAGSSVRVLTHGTYRDNDGFGGDMTVGAKLYAPEALGTLTTTIPTTTGDLVQVMGVATGVRSAFINPSMDVIEHA
jgi:hypothetical protein